MLNDIVEQVWVNLNWLVLRIKWLSVKLVGFVVMCWVLIGVVWLGLVLPVNLVMKKGWDNAVVNSGRNGIVDRRVYSVRDDLNLGRVKNSGSGQGYATVRNEMKRANDSVNEARRLGKGIEALIGQ
ncbi:MAG: hypothetical protein A3G33_11260 [Omnitrophica bacterium RIFCSPLOWO2_12_FULL_44_17]|uniref:Uncharacterized protein n=1 Tax=Candidatus Danuiimicrobium aquiferis TaxID=1801832 RepID=A0A1G1KRY2_9BACT|nr:MAG: hypothetical protein A3B72_09095 [Omnitrophica bacterium RIFCSPHIGHO2_02_FULL_45_28]OGW88348.1 MAG: hypothetical protein A3E74_10585 [Omnitrophica bacterium RIFCSPHIGHO2_12_FULL_44_12]OGW95575.1 MAG: hypothetical protein A3G33_11260 [Omnitrophica bacterium RIFCSPLOWO2_12_FULL_44_17]OGX03710.1 MAG: hypothetical protein A3J12_01230 [Omnitrophica bacterium RIFCSPLOWO2_02_FULL_44_11]